MCMNFIFYLVVGFSKQFHLAYGFEANKMRSSSKKMHLSTAQRVRASLKTHIKEGPALSTAIQSKNYN